MTDPDGHGQEPTVLTAFQVEVARLSFSLPSSDRFLLAGGTIGVRQSTTTFGRLVVHGPQDLLVDIALDSPPLQPATASFPGPTFAPQQVAARKLLALFDRTEARDFADVCVLLQTYTKSELLAWAKDVDAGFEPLVVAEQLGTLRRFLDSDLPVESTSVAQLREFFDGCRHELTS